MSGKKWQRRFISFILELGVGIRTFFLLTDQSMFVGLEVVFTGRQSVVWTCLFRKTEVQQKESGTSFFPAGTLSQSCAGLLLKLHCIPHGLLGSFVPSLICSSSRSVCLHGRTQGNHICIHHLAASPPLNAVLRVWGSSSCSMSLTACHIGVKDGHISCHLSAVTVLQTLTELEMRSTSSESNPATARPSV